MLDRINQYLSIILSSSVYRSIFVFIFGALLFLSSPALGQGWIAWFGLVPLFILIKSSRTYTEAILDTFNFFLVYYLFSFTWLLGLYPLSWHGFSLDESFFITALAWLLPSFFHTLILIPFGLVFKLFIDFRTEERSKELKALDVGVLSFLWVLLTHQLSLNLPENFSVFSVPLSLLAYSQYKNLYLIQSANTIGAIGIEYIIVLFNIWLGNLFNVSKLTKIPKTSLHSYNILKKFTGVENPRQEFFLGLGIISSILSISLYGFIKLELIQDSNPKALKLKIVQSHLASAETRSVHQSMTTKEIIEHNLKLSYPNAEKSYDLLFWPEGSVPSINYENTFFLKEIAQVSKAFIYGTYVLDPVQEELFNSIAFNEFTHTKNGILLKESFYHKEKLVPFGEYTPFWDLLPETFQNLAKSTVGAGFNPARKNQAAIEILNFKIGSSICFELLFPDLIRSQVSNGAEILINLNDLSWFKNDLISRNFLAAGVFRAIENNRDLVLVSNYNYSALIDSTGKIESLNTSSKASFIEAEASLDKNLSLFTLYGW
jgi:apolipoprotein N-acyltransferase